MSKISSIFGVFLFFGVLNTGVALKCLQCGNEENRWKCSANNPALSVECPVGTPFCQSASSSALGITMKQCALVLANFNPAAENQQTNINRCNPEQEIDGIGKLSVCICSTDNCNGGMTVKISSTVLLLSIAFLL